MKISLKNKTPQATYGGDPVSGNLWLGESLGRFCFVMKKIRGAKFNGI
jgi:hypothetical protein